MPEKKKTPGGPATARVKGKRGVVVHHDPADYERLKAAAAADGRTLKEWCRRAIMEKLDATRQT